MKQLDTSASSLDYGRDDPERAKRSEGSLSINGERRRTIEIYIDGASKGNPGPSAVGVIICRDGRTIKNISSYIGNTTNNIAEYTALIYALQEALILKAQNIMINTDSQLLYRQLKKIYKIKNPNILGLYNQAMHLMSGFAQVGLNHISRELNRGADKLADLAIKKALKKK